MQGMVTWTAQIKQYFEIQNYYRACASCIITLNNAVRGANVINRLNIVPKVCGLLERRQNFGDTFLFPRLRAICAMAIGLMQTVCFDFFFCRWIGFDLAPDSESKPISIFLTRPRPILIF